MKMRIVGKLADRAIGKRIPPCAAVIAAGGCSRRMGGTDKLFAALDGMPVLARTLLAFEGAKCIREIVVVTRAENLERTRALCGEYGLKKVTRVVPGGEDRLRSVYAGLQAVSRRMKLTAVHDGARPLVSGELIHQVVREAARRHAAIPVLPAGETVKAVKDGRVTETRDRSETCLAQTPQVFDTDLLKAALCHAIDTKAEVTDDAQAAELIGLKAACVAGERRNIKITEPEDLLIAHALLGGMKDADRTGL